MDSYLVHCHTSHLLRITILKVTCWYLVTKLEPNFKLSDFNFLKKKKTFLKFILWKFHRVSMHSDYSYPNPHLPRFHVCQHPLLLTRPSPNPSLCFVLFCDLMSLTTTSVDGSPDVELSVGPAGTTNGDLAEDNDYPTLKSIISLLCTGMICVSCCCCPFFSSFWHERYMNFATLIYVFHSLHYMESIFQF